MLESTPQSPSPWIESPRKEELAALCSQVSVGAWPRRGTQHRGVPRSTALQLGAGSPYLEVRAVVVIPVHDLRLSAIPDQHGDHLCPSQVCMELRGKDVDP